MSNQSGRPSNLASRLLLDRRRFLRDTSTGLGGIALANLLDHGGLLADDDDGPIRPNIDPAHPNAARPPHFLPRAKNVIMVFCSGRLQSPRHV